MSWTDGIAAVLLGAGLAVGALFFAWRVTNFINRK